VAAGRESKSLTVAALWFDRAARGADNVFMRRSFALVGVVAASFVAGCSSSAPDSVQAQSASPPPPAAVTIEPADELTPPSASAGIVKIVTRDRRITLLSGHAGRLVTVEDDRGRVIAKEVDVDALRGLDAEVYQLVHSAQAHRGLTGD
jgi:hypothetical protein